MYYDDKNLLVVSHSYTTFAKQQIDLLADYFANVVVFVRYNPIAETADYLPIRWLEPYQKSSKIDEETPENVEVQTTSLFYLPTDGGYRRLGDRHADKLCEQVRDHPLDFDLIHAHFTWTAGYAARAVAREFDIPFVLTVHANRDRFLDEYENGPEGVYETWRDADAVVRVNRRDLPKIREYSDNAVFIPNGYSRERFSLMDTYVAREQLDIDPDADVVFSLGALKKRKGYHFLVDAIAELVEHREQAGNDTPLVCAIGGHGGQQRAIEKQITERGLEDTVRLLGYIPEKNLSAWMNACDVFALPSTAEGNPTVMFEALGCGKPYVGSDVGGVGEIITDDRYGLLCEAGDVAGLTAVIEEGLAREWDRELILSYAEQFTWQEVVTELLQLYESVMTGGYYGGLSVDHGDAVA
jgi:glycosyltransferase involved in cell wall biosynthesis